MLIQSFLKDYKIRLYEKIEKLYILWTLQLLFFYYFCSCEVIFDPDCLFCHLIHNFSHENMTDSGTVVLQNHNLIVFSRLS